MLEHQKLMLTNLSCDKELFKKELKKSLAWLQSHDIFELHRWVKRNFNHEHKDIIDEVFKQMLISV